MQSESTASKSYELNPGRMMYHRVQRTPAPGGLPSPPVPPPPPRDQSDHRGRKRNLQLGTSCQAIFGAQTFGFQIPPTPPSNSGLSLCPPDAPACGVNGSRGLHPVTSGHRQDFMRPPACKALSNIVWLCIVARA